MNKQELAARIWESANTMRSKIEANDYKDYILGFVFYKFLSDQVEQLMYASDAQPEDLVEVLTEEDEETVAFVQNNLGFFISHDNLYSTWLEKGNDFNVADVRDALAAFDRLILPSRRNVFDGIFNTLQTGLSKLGDSATSQTSAIKKLLDLIHDIPTDGKQGYDVLGFIYEYLIEKFAANAGKKAGEFYTPHEVSLIMSRIIAEHLADQSEIQIYDPTSGSGSLLLNIGQAVAKHMGDPDRIKYFAQELKANTYNLTRMNLIMRGVKADNIVARNGDSLKEDWPMFNEEDKVGTYQTLYVDAVVSNPPYSQKWEPEDMETDPRFSRFGLAPSTKADYAFLLHELFHVKPHGIMTIVLPHGVLFRGGAEAEIRSKLIESNHIDTIIGLPPAIFYGTGIPTIIMVLKQQRDRDDVQFIDASQGFVKEGKYNNLRARDIQRIVDVVSSREDVPHFSRRASRDEIRENDYNLNIPRYVSATLPPEPIDFYATMHGGIPVSEIDALANYWSNLPGLREALFTEYPNGYAELAVTDIRDTIEAHSSATELRETMQAALAGMPESLHAHLVDNAEYVRINTMEDRLKKDLFERLTPMPLVDSYQGYQLLHEHWLTTSNDLEVIQTEGLDAVRRVDPVMVWKKKNNKKVEVQEGWDGRIAPYPLVQIMYLPDLQTKVEELTVSTESVTAELASLVESLSEEDKTDLAVVLNDKGDAFAKTALNKAVKLLPPLLKGETWADGSIEHIQITAKKLLDEQTKLKKQLKEAAEELDDRTYKTIESFTDTQVDEVLTAKWITRLMSQLDTMPSLTLRELENTVRALNDKYAVALTDLNNQIEQIEQELDELLGSLTGSATDMEAVSTLQQLLGGSNV